jgi:putative transposase
MNAGVDARPDLVDRIDSATLERFRLLRPVIDKEVALTAVSRSSGVPEATLRRWLSRYRRQGLAGLQRSQRCDRGQPRCLSPELVAVVEGLALQRPRRSAAAIHRLMCEAATLQGRPAPSYATVHALVRAINPAMTLLAHEGAKAYGQRYELLHRREAAAPNEIWQADHTELDILVHDAAGAVIRPWLTIVIDDYSRAIAAYHLAATAPSALQTALALRRAIWRKGQPGWTICGVPEVLYTDHGCDFTSRHIEQVCAALKMRLVFSQVGQPRGRGRIERFFGALNTCCLAELPGYLTSGAPPPKPGLTMTTLGLVLQRHIVERYNHATHGETGIAPQARWSAGGFLPQMPPSLEALDLLLLTVAQPRQVQRDGIRFQALRYISPTLAAFVGETVTVRYDPADMAEIRVFQGDRFLCRAICQELAGETVSLKEIVAARVERRRTLQATIRSRRSLIDQILARPQTIPEPAPEVTAAPASTSHSTGASRLRRYEHE